MFFYPLFIPPFLIKLDSEYSVIIIFSLFLSTNSKKNQIWIIVEAVEIDFIYDYHNREKEISV